MKGPKHPGNIAILAFLFFQPKHKKSENSSYISINYWKIKKRREEEERKN